MKKLHVITIAVALALAMVITGTVVMSGTAGETEVDVQVVDEITDEITEEYTTVESVDINASRSNLTMEEIMAMYPGYLEFLKASQSQTADIDTTQIPWVPNIYLHP